jgi:hypothetical protein
MRTQKNQETDMTIAEAPSFTPLEGVGDEEPTPSPQECGRGIAEHFWNFLKGEASHCRPVYFMLDNPFHDEERRQLLAELGIADEGPVTPGVKRLLSFGDVVLVRSTQAYENGQPFGVAYALGRTPVVQTGIVAGELPILFGQVEPV